MAGDNLVLRGGNWYVRLSVPADVRPLINRREFTASLKTGSKREAQALKLPFLQAWRDQINQARTLSAGSAEEQREQAYKASQATEHFLNNAVTQTALGRTQSAAPDFQALAETLDLSGSAKTIAKLMFDKYEGQLDLAESVELLKAMSMHAQADVFDNLQPVDPEEIKKILKDPSEYRSKSPITATRLKEFAEYQSKVRGVAQKTVDDQLRRLKKLKTWLEAEQRELNHYNVGNYLNTLNVSNKTKKQVIFAGSSFWKWALKHDPQFSEQHRSEVPAFQKHEFVEKLGARRGLRKDFSPEEIRRLHDSSKQQKNRETLSDLILLGAYTGARIEEICRLKSEDIVVENDVRCFSIHHSKTKSSERLVPIHQSAMPTVDRLLAQTKDGYLIPSTSKNKYDKRSDPLSKQFGRLKKELGFGPEYVFHSLRKSFITQLQHNDIPGLIIASIVGHETGTITFDVYSSGPSPKQKFKAITTLQYGITG